MRIAQLHYSQLIYQPVWPSSKATPTLTPVQLFTGCQSGPVVRLHRHNSGSTFYRQPVWPSIKATQTLTPVQLFTGCQSGPVVRLHRHNSGSTFYTVPVWPCSKATQTLTLVQLFTGSPLMLYLQRLGFMDAVLRLCHHN